MADAEFISKFIADCAANNLTPIDIAKKEIAKIDVELNAAEKLKIRRMKLVSVLDFLGDDTYRRRRANSTPSSDDIDISSDDILDLLESICSVINTSKPLTVRELILGVGGYDQDAIIMRAVKWLGDQEIVSRDSEGRVKPGKNWDKRSKKEI